MLYRRRRLLLLAQTPSDPNLQSLITALFGNGEQGAFFVPKPQVLGQQVLFQDAAGTTPVTADGDPVGLMLDISKGMAMGPELFEGFTDIGQWTDNGDGSWSISGLGDGEGSDLNGDDSFAVRTGALILIEYDLTVTSGRVRTFLRHTAPDIMPRGIRARMTQIVTSGLFRIRADQGAVATISNISIREILGNHATQEVSGSRPIYRTDGQYHWLEFDGVDDFMGCGPVITGTSYFMAGVASSTEGDILAPVFATSTDSGKSHVIYCDGRTSPRRLFRYASSDNFIDRPEQYVTDTPEVLSGMRDGSTARGWIDGSVVGEVSSAAGGGSFSDLQIGHYGPFFARINFYGGIVLNYPGATEQHNAAHQYLASLAGVTL